MNVVRFSKVQKYLTDKNPEKIFGEQVNFSD